MVDQLREKIGFRETHPLVVDLTTSSQVAGGVTQVT
jgi:hypothetical protein